MLKTYTQQELKDIIEAHRKWLAGEQSGQRASLYGANLQSASLYGANLQSAFLYGANLQNADLRGANLYDANLRDANLQSAFLYGANLRDANLRDANLQNADLQNADLRDANLRDANLYDANLRDANIQFAIVPSEGSFIGWKKVQSASGQRFVIKVQIPAKAKRTSCYISRKNRAESVKTIAAFTPSGEPVQDLKSFVAIHDSKTIYAIGQVTKADKFDGDPRNECTSGIHFFITQDEANAY